MSLAPRLFVTRSINAQRAVRPLPFADREAALARAAEIFLASSIAGLGFGLGTRAQMSNLDEGHPNALQGGKRPRTTLSPTLVLRQGEPWLAFGTPGGDQQDQWAFNFFLAHTVFGLNLQEAIDAPMFHSSHFPSSFYPHESHPGRLVAENRLELETVLRLRDRGHDLVLDGAWSLGRLAVAGKDPKTGQLMAAANPRGMQGYAVGR